MAGLQAAEAENEESGTQGGPPRKRFKFNIPNQYNSCSSSGYIRGSGSSGYTYNRGHIGGNISYGGRGSHQKFATRSENPRLSREFVSPLEWRLHPGVVQTIFLRMDRPQIDLFASDENRQLEGYCSRHQEYLAYRTDSLKMSWKNVFGYAFPLLALVHVVLDKLEQSRTLSKQCRAAVRKQSAKVYEKS